MTFHFLSIFQRAESEVLMRSNLSTCSFTNTALSSVSKKYLPKSVPVVAELFSSFCPLFHQLLRERF